MRTLWRTITALFCLAPAVSLLASGLERDALIGGPPPTITAETFVNVPVVRQFGPFTCAPAQKTSEIAYNGRTYLVGWSENLPKPTVFVGRLSHAHHPLDGRGNVIVDSPNFQLLPVIASNGTDFMVVWVEETGELHRIVRARRVNADGVPVGGITDLSIRAARVKPDVVWTGTHYLVAWTELSLDSVQSVVARRINSDAVPIDAASMLVSSTPDRNATEPALATNGTDSLLVWAESDVVTTCPAPPCPFTTRNIKAARISNSGLVLDSPGIEITPPGTVAQSAPDVDWDGSRFFVVWSRDAADPAARGIFGRFVLPEGIPVQAGDNNIGMLVVVNQGADLLRARVTSDGTGHLVVWELFDSGDRSLYGSRVSKDGTPVDQETLLAQGFPIALDINDERDPAILGRTDGVVAIFYTKETPDQCPDSSRIAARFIGDEPDDPEVPDPSRRRPARRR